MFKFFNELNQEAEVNKLGGKAYSLVRLVEAGFKVPNGFVIKAGQEAVDEELFKAFDKLGSEFVAVRSSAVAEDSAVAAWAGQLDTFLNVKRSDLVERIKDCKKSILSERAQSYAKKNQVEVSEEDVAVIVQAMVQSEVSGVAFSVHPVTKKSDVVVIEAGLGLGEAIVSAQVTPDTLIVNKESGNTLETHIGNQLKALYFDGQQNSFVALGREGEQAKLSSEQVSIISGVVIKLEEYFGFPVDVEWAYYKDQLFITQCRPITAL